MTSEEHDRDYLMKFEEGELLRGYIQCDALVNRLASRFPEDPFVWTGTVSERLAYLLILITGNVELFKDMVKRTQESGYNQIDGKAGKAIKYPVTTTINLSRKEYTEGVIVHMDTKKLRELYSKLDEQKEPTP